MAELEDDERFSADELFEPTRQRSLRRLPALLITAARIARDAAPHEFRVTTGLQVVLAVAAAVQVFIIRGLLDGLLQLDDGTTVGEIAPWLFAFVGIAALLTFSTTLRVERQRLMGELVARHTTGEVLDIAASADLLAYETPSFYNQLQRARINASARPSQMVGGLLTVGGSLMAIIAVAAAIALVTPLLLLLILLAYVPLWLVLVRVSRAEYRFAVAQTERDRRRQHFFDVLSRRQEAAELRAFGHTDFIRSAYDDLYDARITDVRELVSRRTRLGLLGALGNAILTGAVMLALVWMATTDRLSPADAGAVAGALLLIASRLSVLAGGSGSLYESALFMEDYTSFISTNQPTESVDVVPTNAIDFADIEVQGVGFTYPSRTEPAVHDVTMRIRRGEVIALVGENGSGKTTVAKMLAGLLPAQSGAITWDGIPTDELGDSIRESVGVVFQDYVKYLLTVRDNITIGRIEERSDQERFETAARRAGVLAVLDGLPDGADTQLGTEWAGGVELSVGQWQRIAIARGYFRDAPFLILDEPTAALDPRAEAAVFDSIGELYEGRTVLLISHRFSSVRSADRIYVMSKGAIIEHGTHSELMDAAGTYHDLFTLQARRYLDEDGV
jgi:ATP-binding cassette subfamily B protein